MLRAAAGAARRRRAIGRARPVRRERRHAQHLRLRRLLPDLRAARPPLTRARHGARARCGRRCGRRQGERPAVLNAENDSGATQPHIFKPLNTS